MNQSILIHNSRLFWIRKYFLTGQTLAPVRQYALSGWRASSLSTQSRCAHSPSTKAHCVHTPSLSLNAHALLVHRLTACIVLVQSLTEGTPLVPSFSAVSQRKFNCPNGVNYELIYNFSSIWIATDAWKHKKNVAQYWPEYSWSKIIVLHILWLSLLYPLT